MTLQSGADAAQEEKRLRVNGTWKSASSTLVGCLTLLGTCLGFGLGMESGFKVGAAAAFAVGTSLCAAIGPIGSILAAIVGIPTGVVAGIALGVLGATIGALCCYLSTMILNILLITLAAICGQNRETLKTLAFVPFTLAIKWLAAICGLNKTLKTTL